MIQISSTFPVFGERYPLQAVAGAKEIRNELTRKLRTALGPVAETGRALKAHSASLSASPIVSVVAPSQRRQSAAGRGAEYTHVLIQEEGT
jgi:hypothetical protein